MKQLNRFVGKVILLGVSGGPSKVILTDLSNNRTTETMATTPELLKNGIGEGDDFELLVLEDDKGKPYGEMHRIVLEKVQPPSADEFSI